MATGTRRRGKPPPDDEAAATPPTNADASEATSSDVVPATTNGDGTEPRKPVHMLSYLVGRDAFVQASIWERLVRLADGTEFIAHDVTVRKRCKDAAGDWQSYHAFRGSELYAVAHAVQQANAWIL